MDADERDIYHYMKHHGREFIPALEVCRRVGGKRRFRNNQDWARPALARMVERGILESDPEGRFRLKPMPKQEPTGKKWASQEIVKLLEKKGKPVDKLLTVVDEDEYYESL